MLVFFVRSVEVAGCLSPPPSTKNDCNDIAYATKSETQKLNIYLPNEGKTPFPVIIAFHGGGFYEGNKSKEHIAFVFPGLNHGYAVITVNYRLSDEAKFPAAINDAKAAERLATPPLFMYRKNSSEAGIC